MAIRRIAAARGFTLIELLVVIAIAGILVALAAPSFTDQFARRRIEGVATDLSTDLHFARSQAVSDRGTVTLQTEGGGTQYRIFNAAGNIKTVVLPAGIVATDGVIVAYEQLRGTATVTNGPIGLQSTRTTAQVRLDINAMGRVSLCTPDASLKGYASC